MVFLGWFCSNDLLDFFASQVIDHNRSRPTTSSPSLTKNVLANPSLSQNPDPNNMSSCANCGSVAKKRCSRCKSVFFCGNECQSRFWKSGHKDVCRAPPPDRVTSKLAEPVRAADAIDDFCFDFDDLAAVALMGGVMPVGQGIGARLLGTKPGTGLRVNLNALFTPSDSTSSSNDERRSSPFKMGSSPLRTIDRIVQRKNDFPSAETVKKNLGPFFTLNLGARRH